MLKICAVSTYMRYKLYKILLESQGKYQKPVRFAIIIRKEGRLMQEVVKILDNDNLGNGIARIDNKVIFVKEALKDEEVVIKIIGEKKSYATAVISELKKEALQE